MDIEFHYYITHYLLRKAGFPEAECNIIAYASQYVDDNLVSCKIKKQGKLIYKNQFSQTARVWRKNVKLFPVCLSFHYIPGDYLEISAYRSDGKFHLLNTTPDSGNSRTIMDEALKTGNPYRIGVALHSYADTWAHQNFIGCKEKFNAVKNFFKLFVPTIGHTHYLKQPDRINLFWKDVRLIASNRDIGNHLRFMEAAEKIFKRLKRHKAPNITDDKLDALWNDELKPALIKATGTQDDETIAEERLMAYKGILGVTEAYRPGRWFNDAVITNILGLKDLKTIFGCFHIIPDTYTARDGFQDSHWKKFQDAVKEHRQMAMELFRKRFKLMELKI